jgi:hypothetical protein
MRNGVPWLRQPNFRSEGVQKTVDRYNFPLKGKVLRYEKLTEPVAQDDWEIMR